MSLWDSIKDKAMQVGSAAGAASQRTKLHAELMLADREIKSLQYNFGIQLYNHVFEMTKTPEFFANSDLLTETLRPPLLTAQREIAALELKQRKLKEEMAQAEVDRAAAFPTPAVNWQEKLKNAGKSTAMAGSEAKLKTEGAVLETKVKSHKQQFGVDVYERFEKLEDSRGWLPTDRDIRSYYDSCRKDIEDVKKRKAEKIKELESLGGTYEGPGVSQVGTYVVDSNTSGASASNGDQQSSATSVTLPMDSFHQPANVFSSAPAPSPNVFSSASATTAPPPSSSSASAAPKDASSNMFSSQPAPSVPMVSATPIAPAPAALAPADMGLFGYPGAPTPAPVSSGSGRGYGAPQQSQQSRSNSQQVDLLDF